ncbi:MAG: adenylyltransferase/cytidyltransferase family protein [Alphaproteobacteria bacterium]|nr:adenylyltransferase/cytidyltransferase family protein [Alphaproteobacteria bacterium]
MIVGYTTGVYDLFHIGHLNLLKKCKKRCDFLIVGINTDEMTMAYKKRKPVICCSERMKIVSAVRYVDKAVARRRRDNPLAEWKKHKFNVWFVGSDWKGSEQFERIARLLKPKGVRIVYLPYTKGISSTALRKKMKKA